MRITTVFVAVLALTACGGGGGGGAGITMVPHSLDSGLSLLTPVWAVDAPTEYAAGGLPVSAGDFVFLDAPFTYTGGAINDVGLGGCNIDFSYSSADAGGGGCDTFVRFGSYYSIAASRMALGMITILDSVGGSIQCRIDSGTDELQSGSCPPGPGAAVASFDFTVVGGTGRWVGVGGSGSASFAYATQDVTNSSGSMAFTLLVPTP